MQKFINLKVNIALGLIFAFLLNSFGPLPLAQAQEFRLPAPGVRISLSPEFNPPILKGIKVHPDNPFKFDFILDQGDNSLPLVGRVREGGNPLPLGFRNDVASIGANIIREIVIPELTKEINEDKNFSQLRQVYNSLILATWYKKRIKDSILAQVYADKNKVKGLSSSNVLIGDPEHIYQQYLQAFKKGVYNYIKEEQDPLTQEIIPRKYFSGGFNFSHAMMSFVSRLPDQAMVEKRLIDLGAELQLPSSTTDNAEISDKKRVIPLGELINLASPDPWKRMNTADGFFNTNKNIFEVARELIDNFISPIGIADAEKEFSDLQRRGVIPAYKRYDDTTARRLARNATLFALSRLLESRSSEVAQELTEEFTIRIRDEIKPWLRANDVQDASSDPRVALGTPQAQQWIRDFHLGHEASQMPSEHSLLENSRLYFLAKHMNENTNDETADLQNWVFLCISIIFPYKYLDHQERMILFPGRLVPQALKSNGTSLAMSAPLIKADRAMKSKWLGRINDLYPLVMALAITYVGWKLRVASTPMYKTLGLTQKDIREYWHPQGTPISIPVYGGDLQFKADFYPPQLLKNINAIYVLPEIQFRLVKHTEEAGAEYNSSTREIVGVDDTIGMSLSHEIGHSYWRTVLDVTNVDAYLDKL